ncbi:MAG: hypothetical protein HQL46_07480 [Gammaproteobacteria bacterium]|nr:hypothetical protein [Gammaproteobacteria bacterium]
MNKAYFGIFMVLSLLMPGFSSFAAESKEIRQQRKEANKERLSLRKERSENIRNMRKIFQEFSRDLKKSYQDDINELKVEFDLKQIDIDSAHEVKITEAKNEYQKKMMNLFLSPKTKLDETTLKQFEKDAEIYSDQLFAFKKQFAEQTHKKQLNFVKQKNSLWDEMDQKILAKAEELGMTNKITPILAKQIAGTLSKSEERWNQRENKEATKIQDKLAYLLRNFRKGNKIRAHELESMKQDFILEWENESKLHKIEGQSVFINQLLMQSFSNQKFNLEEFTSKMSELNKEKQLLNIEYKKNKKKKSILRKKELKEILEN